MIRAILTHPDPVLRGVSRPVGLVDGEVHALLDDMLDTMRAAKGWGLAAVQVGVLRRAVVVDAGSAAGGAPQPRFLLDPEILWWSDERARRQESCLSIPDAPSIVERPVRIGVRYRDRQGVVREEALDGLLALVVQHEIDHLDGVLILDRATDRPGAPPGALEQIAIR